MKVVSHKQYTKVYSRDPAAEKGRIESILDVIKHTAQLVEPAPARLEQIELAHSEAHIKRVRREGLYDIAALAAGGAIETALIGLTEPAFGCIRPPGHHASHDHAWGFCFFNNLAIALLTLKQQRRIDRALVIDIDLHYGDGTVDILGHLDWVHILNPQSCRRKDYLDEIRDTLGRHPASLIAISAGFDHARSDWGDMLEPADYRAIGRMVKSAALAQDAGCFAILEGGYNQTVLGHNVMALIKGLELLA